MAAICNYCNQEMKEGAGCTLKTYNIYTKKYGRIPYTPDSDRYCHDCNVGPGQFHHPGCDMERCPKCGGQAIACGCSDEE